MFGLTFTVDMIFMGETKSYKCVEPREMLNRIEKIVHLEIEMEIERKK